MNIQKFQIQLLKNEFKVNHKPMERFYYEYTKHPQTGVECVVIVHYHGIYVIESSKLFLDLSKCTNGERRHNAIDYINNELEVDCYDTKTVIERSFVTSKTKQHLHKLQVDKKPVYLNEDDLKVFWDLSCYILKYQPRTNLVYFYDTNNRLVGCLTTVLGVDNI